MNAHRANNHTIVVTGGAGYIGAFTTLALYEKGFRPIILDKKPKAQWPAELRKFEGYTVHCGNVMAVSQILRTHNAAAVMHLAALTSVIESENSPEKYFRNNVLESLGLLDAMRRVNCKYVIFSSSAAVFSAHNTAVNEDTGRLPVNVYGETKKTTEDDLVRASREYGLTYIILRYFNVGGASPDGNLGNGKTGESKLIPALIRAQATKTPLTIFGNDFPSRDGTAVRDHVYVGDVAGANVSALEYLLDKKTNDTFHIGSGRGYTNLEVVRALEKIKEDNIQVIYKNRRVNEVGTVKTSIRKAKKVLGWKPSDNSLKTILETSERHYMLTGGAPVQKQKTNIF